MNDDARRANIYLASMNIRLTIHELHERARGPMSRSRNCCPPRSTTRSTPNTRSPTSAARSPTQSNTSTNGWKPDRLT